MVHSVFRREPLHVAFGVAVAEYEAVYSCFFR